MGLLDVLSGISNAESGQRAPGSSDGGMSPITKVIIGVLAYQAIKAFTGGQASGGTNPAGGKQSPETTGDPQTASTVRCSGVTCRSVA
jgi:hypothetical protein